MVANEGMFNPENSGPALPPSTHNLSGLKDYAVLEAGRSESFYTNLNRFRFSAKGCASVQPFYFHASLVVSLNSKLNKLDKRLLIGCVGVACQKVNGFLVISIHGIDGILESA